MLPLEGSAGYEEKTTGTNTGSSEVEYNEDNIRHLDDMEHIRVRSGMYIGRLGDGSQNDDGIYVLLKEVMDNSIDEFKMGAGKRIEVNIEENLRVSVRDYGRGIPQGKLVEAVSKLSKHPKKEIAAMASIITAAISYLALLEENCPVYNGLKIQQESGWEELEEGINLLVDLWLQKQL